MGTRDILTSPPVENHGRGPPSSLNFVQQDDCLREQDLALPTVILLVWVGLSPLLTMTACYHTIELYTNIYLMNIKEHMNEENPRNTQNNWPTNSC